MKILQICAPARPTFVRRRKLIDESKTVLEAPLEYIDERPIDLWALVEDDGDRRIVGIEMVDMEYLIDEEKDFLEYTHIPPDGW